MPGLSKRKTFAKPRNFQCPLKMKANIASVLGDDFQKMQNSKPNTRLSKDKIDRVMTVIENQQLQRKSDSNNLSRSSSITLSFSQSTSEMDSETMNDPKVKAAYFNFVDHLASLSSQLDKAVSSTPKSSQELKIVLQKCNSIENNMESKSIEHFSKGLEGNKPKEKEQLSKFTGKTKKNSKKNGKVNNSKNVVKNKADKKDKPRKKKFNMDNFVCKKPNSDTITLSMNNNEITTEQIQNTESKIVNLPEKSSQKKRKSKAIEEIKSNVNIHEVPNPKLTKKVEINNNLVKKNKSVKETPSFVYHKMKEIHEYRNVGLYVMCDSCDKYRYLPHVTDPLDLPEKWYCYLNPDENHNKCDDPEEEEQEEDKGFCIQNCYNSGSVVWARVDGYPWWPAMVEDDPDYETYYWLKGSLEPTDYHVTFFDTTTVTRAWVNTSNLKPFKVNMFNPLYRVNKFSQYHARLEASFRQAMNAVKLDLIDRLRTYSFIERYPHGLNDLVRKKKKVQKSPKTKRPKNPRRIVSSDLETSELETEVDRFLNSFNEEVNEFSFNLLENSL